MRELSRHAFAALNDDLLRALETGEAGGVTAWLDQVFETLGDQGHARLLAWGTLTGRDATGDGDPHLLCDLAAAVHARRVDGASLEETAFAVRFVAAALLGDALLGPVLEQSAGHAEPAARERFRGWLARRVRGLLIPEPERT